MVGFDEHFARIMDELTGDEYDLQVLPIVGMGGIGKTTLARNAFDNSYIMRHFDKRTWLTISQEYSIQRVFLGLLGELSDWKNEESGESLAKLGDRLHKRLFDRRYLIVLDDVWSTDLWNDIKSSFPNNKNGSRIMVTTRLSNVAVSFSSRNPYLMDLLDKGKSWNLFCEKTFAKDVCPPELEEVGKSIAKSCKGLPLAIVVIGGLLSKSSMTREYWEFLAKDVNSFANLGDDEHCLKVLALSYNHLPIHLKPCFLYMRVFPEDTQIDVSELIKLWVAEGFLKPMKDKTMEEVAKEYLGDLIGRNLILVRRLWKDGEIRECAMHDLVRDLCIRESKKEHYYCVPKVQRHFNLSSKRCFLCRTKDACTWIDLPRGVVATQPTSLAHCLVCDVCRIMYPQLNNLRLVKVLEHPYNTQSFREEIMHPLRRYRSFSFYNKFLFGMNYKDVLHPVKLRFLSIYDHFQFASNSIHLLWNLQTLIIKSCPVVIPVEIWELAQLRHLETKAAILCDPPLNTDVDRKDSTIILKNFQTLYLIINFRWSKDVIERMPNMKKLEINYHDGVQEWSYYSLHNLGLLHTLESLSLGARKLLTLKNIAFPHSLKELTLKQCTIPWEEMTIIGSLPNLEVLKLYDDAFKDREWKPVEEEFLQLKLLFINNSDLVHWGAEKIHFPNLEHLELQRMRYLEKIPSGIGQIETLRSISMGSCTDSAVNSAKEILEEQHSFGNEDLQLYVDYELVLPGSG